MDGNLLEMEEAAWPPFSFACHMTANRALPKNGYNDNNNLYL